MKKLLITLFIGLLPLTASATLIGGGTSDSSGNITDIVRSTTCTKEASVTGGSTVSDNGTRNIAETHFATASGNRIDCGVFTFDTSYTIAVRFIYRAQSGSTVYASLASRGSVFENDSQFAIGMRDGALTSFEYARNGGSLLGTEDVPYGKGVDVIYTEMLRWQNGTQEQWLFGTDVGGAGVNEKLLDSSSSGDASDGGQHLFIGGPNTPGTNDNSGNFGILGYLYYDTYVSDTVKGNIRDDFYGQIVAPTPPPAYKVTSFVGGIFSFFGGIFSFR